MTTLIFIRHAFSQGNLLEVCSGQLDYPLIEKGFEQAKKTAAYLRANYPLEAIYTSDLCRTVQTAQPTADAFGLESIPDVRFREAYVGEWQGQLWRDLEEQYPDLYKLWISYQMDRNTPRPKGAECSEEILDRVNAAISDVIAKNKGKCVAIFAHGRMIHVLSDFWRTQNPAFDAEIKKRGILCYNSCSVTVAEYDDNGNFLGIPLCNYRDFLNENGNAVAAE